MGSMRGRASKVNNPAGVQYYDQADFIKKYMKVYKEGGALSDLSEIIGLSASATNSRIHRLRTLGVRLPNLNKLAANRRTDVAALNRLIEEEAGPAKPPKSPAKMPPKGVI